MDFNANPIDVFVATKLVCVATLQLTCMSSSSVVDLLQHFNCLCNFLPFILLCHDKVKKCRDKYLAFKSPFFIVSLSQHS